SEWGEWSIEMPEGSREFVATRSLIPVPALYPVDATGSFVNAHPWNKIPIGIDETGGVAVIDVLTDDPHTLVAGATGSGKSVAQRAILLHVMMHDEWEVLGIDLKRVELGPLAGLRNVTSVATDLATAVSVLED